MENRSWKTENGKEMLQRMTVWWDFLPLLPLAFSVGRVAIVHISAERQLREAYGAAGMPFRHPTGPSAGNAWSILKPLETDPPALVELKERLRDEVKRRLRHTVPILLGGSFGFALMSIILHSLLAK
jgi:hypothetical protein